MRVKKQSKDQEILEGIRHKMPNAIKYMYTSPYRKAFGMLIKMGASAEDAEDILQDTLLVFIKSVSKDDFKLRENVSISSYFCGIAKNVFFNLIRDRKREKNKIQNNTANTFYTLSFPEEDDNIKRLKEGINRLTEGTQQILKMFYYQGYSYKAIVEELHPEYFDPDQNKEINAAINRYTTRVNYAINRIKETLLG